MPPKLPPADPADHDDCEDTAAYLDNLGDYIVSCWRCQERDALDQMTYDSTKEAYLCHACLDIMNSKETYE